MTTEYEACETATKRYFLDFGASAEHPSESYSRAATGIDETWIITLANRHGDLATYEWLPGVRMRLLTIAPKHPRLPTG